LTSNTDRTDTRVYVDTSYVLVLWLPAADAMSIRWKAWANSQELRDALNIALNGLSEHHSHRLLMDLRLGRAFVSEDQEWVAKTWIPALWRAGLTRTAMVLPQSAVLLSGLETMFKMVPPNPATERRFFATPEEAEVWLRK
jgi:hypothetical protein